MNGVGVKILGKVECSGGAEGDVWREQCDEGGAKGGGGEEMLLKVVCDMKGFSEGGAFTTSACVCGGGSNL